MAIDGSFLGYKTMLYHLQNVISNEIKGLLFMMKGMKRGGNDNRIHHSSIWLDDVSKIENNVNLDSRYRYLCVASYCSATATG
jgi:hypothetical protein